ncbi:MAG: SDR family oxidoreductase [Myxococcales bacterium]|nr:SDR family oxidoreductase [Myxococcales bacterium]
MAIFVTGTTGYLGSYLATLLLRDHSERLALLVRAKSEQHALERLWQALQLQMSFEEFVELVPHRCDLYLGDLTEKNLGLDDAARQRLIESTDSVIHCAASLNRKSAKACFNVNLRGTLEIVKIARAAQDDHGLRRFSDISTVAVAGHRKDAVVHESEIIDWQRSDYDPYARTKKFCEHMVHELLPDVPTTVFRPSIILGDSRFPETTQFDMVRAFVWLAKLPILPFREDWLVDIVPADYVADAVVTIHQSDAPRYDAYDLSSGTESLTYGQVVDALSSSGHRTRPIFLPFLEQPFTKLVDALSNSPREWGLVPAASLMKVFLPYLVFNTVFDNSRVVEEMGRKPTPFSEYAYPLFRFASEGNFRYPYRPWPKNSGAFSTLATANP